MTPNFRRKVTAVGTTAEIGDIARAASSANFSTSVSAAVTLVPNQTVALKCTGGAVRVELTPADSTGGGGVGFSASKINNSGAGGNESFALVYRNGVRIADIGFRAEYAGGPPGAFNFTDFSAPIGANTYEMYVLAGTGSTIAVFYSCLTAYEL